MSYVFEAVLFIPFCLIIFCFAIFQFPKEYDRSAKTAAEAAAFHVDTPDLYLSHDGNYFRGVKANPEILVDLILRTEDTITSIQEIVKGR